MPFIDNSGRGKLCRPALDLFMRAAGLQGESLNTGVGDLIADLLHLLDANPEPDDEYPMTTAMALSSGVASYICEKVDEDGMYDMGSQADVRVDGMTLEEAVEHHVARAKNLMLDEED